MFIEEKLDLLKQELSDKDFSIRYIDYKSIMSKIELKFLSSENLNYQYNGWIERLKSFTKSNFSEDTFDYLNNNLSSKEMFWWVYVDNPCYANSRHRLFEATLLGGERLSFLFSESPIFIVHKKYHWMMMLNRKSKIIEEKAYLKK